MKRWIIGILRTVGMIGAQTAVEIISHSQPVIGAIVSTILNRIVQAEARYGSGTGQAKKEFVLESIDGMAPLILAAVEQQTGRELADDAQFAAGVDQITDGIVAVLNSFRIFPAPAAAPAEPTA